MRLTRGSWSRWVAMCAICMLFVVSGNAMAAPNDQGKDKEKTKGSAQSGKIKEGDLQSFLQSMAMDYCESSCCYAWHTCWGGWSSCSDNYCSAGCPDGEYSGTWCWEM